MGWDATGMSCLSRPPPLHLRVRPPLLCTCLAAYPLHSSSLTLALLPSATRSIPAANLSSASLTNRSPRSMVRSRTTPWGIGWHRLRSVGISYYRVPVYSFPFNVPPLIPSSPVPCTWMAISTADISSYCGSPSAADVQGGWKMKYERDECCMK